MVRLRMISLGPIAVDNWKTASMRQWNAKDDDALAQRFLDALQLIASACRVPAPTMIRRIPQASNVR